MLSSHYKRIGSLIGIDRSIAYSSGARVVQGITGVGSVFFIATFLSQVEQGFYYAFGSILALQVFLELGLTGIITQYFSHEVVHLRLGSNLHYQGDATHKSRLASLIRLFVKWYLIVSVVCLIALMVAGFVYFEKFGDTQGPTVSWRGPWVLICIGTAVKLFQSPFSAGLQGLGYVKEISKIGFIQQIIIPVVTWIGLACELKLYVMGIGYLLSVLIWFAYIYHCKLSKLLYNLYNEPVNERVSYWKEIFPFQWKIGLSWISGYFIFQLFVPVLFASEGAVVAGQMGLTLQALNAIQSLSLCWMNTKIPVLSGLIAKKQYKDLDSLFFSTLTKMTTVCTFLLVAFFTFIWILKLTQLSVNGNIFGNRFLDYLPLVLMCVPIYLNQYVSAWATYLRCHKAEPYLVLSVVTGILCLASTYYLGMHYGLYGMTIGYLAIKLTTFSWAYNIFKNKRSEWHSCINPSYK